MTPAPRTAAPADVQALHRRAFAHNDHSFSALYTHLPPCILTKPPALLLACKSSAAYLPENRRRHTVFLSPSNHRTRFDDDDLDDDLVTALAATPCDTRALVAHRSGFVHVYLMPSNSAAPRSFRPFGQSNVVAHIAPHPASQYAAFGAADGSIRVHDIDADFNTPSNLNSNAGFPVTHVMSCGIPITTLAFAPQEDTTILVAGCGDGSLRVFNLATKNSPPAKILRPHVARITSLGFVQPSPGELAVVSTSLDLVLATTPIPKSRKQKLMPKSRLVAMSGPVISSAQLTDGRVVLATQGNPHLTVWDPVEGVQDKAGSLHLPFVSVSSTNKSASNTAKKLITSEANADEEIDDDDEHEGSVSIIHIVSASNGSLIVALSDSTLLRIDASSTCSKSLSKLTLTPRVTCGHLEEIYDVCVLQNNAKAKTHFDLATASNSPVVWVLRNSTAGQWDCVAGLRGHNANVLAVDRVSIAAPDHAQFLASASRDRTVRVWRKPDVESSSVQIGWQCMAVAEGHTDAVAAVAFSPKAVAPPAGHGLFMVSAGADRTLKLWRLDNARKAAAKAQREGMNVDSESGSGKSGIQDIGDDEGDTACDIVDATVGDTGQQIANLTAHWTVLAHEKDVNAVAVSPDGQIIASGSQDRSVKLWRASSGEPIHVCCGHKRGVWSVAFSRVDRIVASASGDTTIRIWSVQSGAMLRTLQGHISGVLRVCFISRGTQLVSGGADGVVKVWTTRSGECDASLGADMSSADSQPMVSSSHSGRVWAVDAVADGDSVISGGADGLIVRWVDKTLVMGEEERKKRETEARMAQVVDSAARGRKWAVAIAAALKLGMTAKLQQLFADVILHSQSPEDELVSIIRDVFDRKERQKKDAGEINDVDSDGNETDTDMEWLVGSETDAAGSGKKTDEVGWERIGKLILCCRDWHAVGGARNASIGSFLLNAILTSWTPSQLVDGLTTLPEGRAVVEALDAHTKRHLDRVNALCDRMPILEHVMATMRGGVDVMEKVDGIRNEQAKDTSVRRKRKRREDVDCDY